EFAAASCDDAGTAEEIRRWWLPARGFGGYLADPHTATGLSAARRIPSGAVPSVVLSTAHPAKFPDAVEAAVGDRPALPDWLTLDGTRERYTVLPPDQARIETFVLERARAARSS